MVQARTVRVTDFGAPEVMQVETIELPAPAAGQVCLRQSAIGFNFIDIYQRRGFYPLPSPTGLGHEAVGIVEAVGDGVTSFKLGDRAGYINAGVGAYADRRNVAAERLVSIPDAVSDEQAAALLFKGMTAQYLLRRTHRVAAGELVMVHSAAGGVGQILSRWAKALGARVVGTVGSEAKRAPALQAGCDIVIDYSKPDWVEAFLASTGGRKARVVYDAVGKDTFLKSLDCVEPFGMMVLYGAASGPVAPIEPELLNKKGCLFLTRPSIFPHNADLARFRENAADLFAAIASGHVKAEIGARFALSDIVKAHQAAEARLVTGAMVIVP